MDFQEMMKAAVMEAKDKLPIREVAARHCGIPVTTKARKFWAKECPGCAKPHKFTLDETGWGCYNSGCLHHNEPGKGTWEYRGQIDLIEQFQGVSRQEARDLFLEYAGVDNPMKSEEVQRILKLSEEKKKRRKKGKSSPPPAPKADPENTESPERPALDEQITRQNIWENIHRSLSLTGKDRKELNTGRGLDDETIDHFQFVSSRRDNTKRLEWVSESLSQDTLLDLGILSFRKNGNHKLSPQLCGAPYKDDDGEWQEREPILIPYWSKESQVVWLRPHKLGLSPKEYLIETKAKAAYGKFEANSHPFVALTHPEPLTYFSNKAVVVESEFKAAALWQIGIPAISLPGVAMLRNEPFAKEFLQILYEHRIRQVIVAFDNDDKSDKPDPWDRYDTEVYAEYTAHVLRKEGIIAQVAEIPDEWREDGKADWDGMLAKIKRDNPKKDHNKIATKVFTSILQGARSEPISLDFFNNDERSRIIVCRLQRLIYEPNIKEGGPKEVGDASLIRKCHPDYAKDLRSYALAQSLFETVRCYYVHKALPGERREEITEIRDEVKAKLNKLNSDPEKGPDTEEKTQLLAALRACEISLQGIPDVISNFTMRCEYTVITEDGTSERMVRLTNSSNEKSELKRPPNKAFASPQEFKTFCLDCGNFVWKTGGNNLDLLSEDMAKFAAYRQIREIPYIGYDEQSKLWIFGDCAVTHDGKFLFPDTEDIIWHDGIGYRADPDDIKAKAMKSVPKLFRPIENKHRGMSAQEIYNTIDWEVEKEECGKILSRLLELSYNSFGDFSGWLAISIIAAYAAGPEVMKEFSGHPGLWVTGRMSSGKTMTVKMLLRMWGYGDYSETNVGGGTTHTALDNTLSDYSFIPLHFDEFREHEVDTNKINSIRNAFNRASKSKGTINARKRTRLVTPRTTPVITGETIISDPATRSRYLQCSMSKETRLPKDDNKKQHENFQEFQKLSWQTHRLIRYILKNRKEYLDTVIPKTDEFIKADDTGTASVDRGIIVYGVAYASLLAIFKMFLGKEEQELQKIRNFTVDYAHESDKSTTQINFVNRFWDSVSSLLATDHEAPKHVKFSYWAHSDDGEYQKDIAPYTDGTPQPGTFPVMILNPKVIYSLYESYQRQRGKTATMELANLRTEIQKDPYWIKPSSHSSSRAWKFSLNKTQVVSWVIRLDLMEDNIRESFMPFIEPGEDDLQAAAEEKFG